MRLISAIILSVFLSAGASWYLTRMYYQNIQENASEDVVSSEIRLLEAVKDRALPCEALLNHDGLVVTQDDNYIIIWRLIPKSPYIDKFVIDKNFESALDQMDNSCSPR